MKPVGRAALSSVITAAVMAAAAPGDPAGIAWVAGYEKGLQTARSEGKPAMLDFTASWCGWCVKLDKETFSDAKVQELARSFVCVKVDADKEQARMKQWGIRGIPHILFLDPEGKPLGRVHGYKPAAPFAQEMQGALGKFTPKPPDRPRERAEPRPAADSPEPVFVECARCGNLFNVTAKKGECPRCGAAYAAE